MQWFRVPERDKDGDIKPWFSTPKIWVKDKDAEEWNNIIQCWSRCKWNERITKHEQQKS